MSTLLLNLEQSEGALGRAVAPKGLNIVPKTSNLLYAGWGNGCVR